MSSKRSLKPSGYQPRYSLRELKSVIRVSTMSHLPTISFYRLQILSQFFCHGRDGLTMARFFPTLINIFKHTVVSTLLNETDIRKGVTSTFSRRSGDKISDLALSVFAMTNWPVVQQVIFCRPTTLCLSEAQDLPRFEKCQAKTIFRQFINFQSYNSNNHLDSVE